MSTTHGSGLCGELRFTAEMPTKWVAHCHCTLCRRAHGAAFVSWVGMEAARCCIDDPQGRLRWYESSPGAERGFCQHCGSTLFFRAEHRWPGELHIALACFHEPVDRAPQLHVYWNNHVEWADVDPGDGLTRRS